MGGKLNLYNLGDLGVHLVETPVHSPDGSFTSAQNASVSQNQGQHGIRKRHGLAKLTGTALDGSILAIASMPFQDPFAPVETSGTRLFVNEFNEGPTSQFISSIDGETWGSATSPTDWYPAVLQNSWTQRGGVISTEGLITYIGSSGELRTFDGTNDTSLTSGYVFGGFASQSGPALYFGVPVLAIADATSGKLLRQNGGAYEELTTAIGKPPTCVAAAIGRVYIGTDENRIYYWSEAEGLVLDVTLTPSGGDVTITDICAYNGTVYATGSTKSGGSTATTHKVLERTADGDWLDLTPTSSGDYGPMAVFDGALFVIRNQHAPFFGCAIHRYDGSGGVASEQDVGLIAPDATRIISLVAFNDLLYATVSTDSTRDIIRRSPGAISEGDWTNVHSTSDDGTTKLYTAMGFY